MREQRSSRLERTLETGRVVADSLVREPVKESVREALAAERRAAGDPPGSGGRRGSSVPDRPPEVDAGEGKNRILRPRTLVVILGLGVAAAVAMGRAGNDDDGTTEFGLGESTGRGSVGPSREGDTTPTSDGGRPAGSETVDGEGSEEDPDRSGTPHQ